MTTLQSGDSPGTRIAAGDSVLEAAKSINTKPVAKRLGALKKIHTKYKTAEAGVRKTSEALQKQQAIVAEEDITQDEAVLALASSLAVDGLPRVNPFKPFGASSPAALCEMGYGEEAKQLLALVAAVLRRKGLSKATIVSANAGGKAAKNVQKALAPIAKLEKARKDAMARRDALAQAWETAFAGLKRGARAAEDDGAKGLHAALFDRKKGKAPAPRAKAKKGAAGGSVEAPA